MKYSLFFHYNFRLHKYSPITWEESTRKRGNQVDYSWCGYLQPHISYYSSYTQNSNTSPELPRYITSLLLSIFCRVLCCDQRMTLAVLGCQIMFCRLLLLTTTPYIRGHDIHTYNNILTLRRTFNGSLQAYGLLLLLLWLHWHWLAKH